MPLELTQRTLQGDLYLFNCSRTTHSTFAELCKFAICVCECVFGLCNYIDYHLIKNDYTQLLSILTMRDENSIKRNRETKTHKSFPNGFVCSLSLSFSFLSFFSFSFSFLTVQFNNLKFESQSTTRKRHSEPEKFAIWQPEKKRERERKKGFKAPICGLLRSIVSSFHCVCVCGKQLVATVFPALFCFKLLREIHQVQRFKGTRDCLRCSPRRSSFHLNLSFFNETLN